MPQPSPTPDDPSDLATNPNFDLTNPLTSHSLILSIPISQLYLCALRNDHNEGDEAGEPPTNHWTLCLETAPTSCVMLDMVPGDGSDGRRGKIEVSALNQEYDGEDSRPYSDETLRAFSFPVLRNTTAREIMEFIVAKGRDAFTFSPEWEGCRFWLSVVMADLEAEGLVEKGAGDEAKRVLMLYWRNPEGSEPRVMREGTFRGAEGDSGEHSEGWETIDDTEL
ncbi:Uu.00g063740.m01.CDS01 [Anthostomella pinea]|uniref:Uu.00g063740.m01.CDS01 n=1 Tax=Anthostomella pinea TaxID=933095 RepID=A0AAI8VTG8_9PEZI|nr:Uu.00g063740.m01.CDS01 [Anthostomella pinea]